MTTLDELQGLADGEFHRLGDNLLRRIDPRYRRLRTHGLNDRGESIKGQPDSYVGDTATTCNIAVQYTVQRAAWWNKVVESVREAVAVSPGVKEIVVVIPHDKDRDGPKDKNIDWLTDTRKAAGQASVRPIDGREISQSLDTDHQDLRHEHLGIPYSRLSGQCILTGCRIASSNVIEAIQRSGRYDPNRYAPRAADRELYWLWQSALRHGANNAHPREAPVRLIALVSDSGVGKTSLMCQFTRSLSTVLPVLVVQAGDLAFGTEDGLVAHVVHGIQGFLDPSVRVIEEAAISKHLPGSMPLTVVLDGLDEAHNPDAVRRAITFWLRSKLGQLGVLIVTSRPEFWRMCSDTSWVRWMPKPHSDDRSPVSVADRSAFERRDPGDGVRLPDRFTADELEAAWLRGGQSRHELFALPTEAREELRHPFTLRVYLDLRIQDGLPQRHVTRAALLDRWLNHRLQTEAVPQERITSAQYQQALRLIATRIAESYSGSIAVDALAGVPRFDSAHPPGPVVQRLIEANILESLPGQFDHVRFSVEAVQDFYRAEADVEEIRADPDHVADHLARLTFTAAFPRLVRIGQRLIDHDVRHGFATRLAEHDARRAAVLLRGAPDQYSRELRARIAEDLGSQIASRHRVRGALAITLLGELNCTESVEVLCKQLLPPANPHQYFKSVGATAFVQLGHAPAAAFTYRSEWFGLRWGTESYFFSELLATIRGATLEFRNALAEQALAQLSQSTGSPAHGKAVTALAYLGDDRLVNHLAARLNENGLLVNYENHALIALGSDAAGAVFARSVLAVGDRLALLPDDTEHHETRNNLIWPVHFSSYDMRYLITPAFEPHLRRLIDDANPDISRIASDLAKRGLSPSLLYSVAVAAAKRESWFEFDRGEQRSCVTAAVWLRWWQESPEVSLQRKLMALLPPYPNAEIEELLLECLDSSELRGSAARRLGEYGAVRSAFRLRGILAEEITPEDAWGKSEAAHSLGDLRDVAAAPLLERLATEHPNGWVVHQAVSSLGLIGTSEAESALSRLLKAQQGEDFNDTVFEALLCCGSPSAVATVIERAKGKTDGPNWLYVRLRRLTHFRGWKSGEYYTHIHAPELVDYLDSTWTSGSPERSWDFVWAFKQIDSPEVRSLLRKCGERRGTAADPLPIFDSCPLGDRGQMTVFPRVLHIGGVRDTKT